MADFEAVTSCNPVTLEDDQIPQVQALLDAYYIPNLEYGPWEDEKTLGFWSYETFEVLEDEDDYYGDDKTDEFLEKLSKILRGDQELVIAWAGHEKLRYVSAAQVTVSQNSVKWLTLGT